MTYFEISEEQLVRQSAGEMLFQPHDLRKCEICKRQAIHDKMTGGICDFCIDNGT